MESSSDAQMLLVFLSARVWLSWGHCCQDLQPQVLHRFLSPHAHTGAQWRGGGSRARRLWRTLPAAASSEGTDRLLGHRLGREMSQAPSGKIVPKKGCGILQAVAVLEDTARGQSACLEFASSCYITAKTPRAAFFLFSPFPAVFMFFSSRSTLCLQTTQGF